MRILHQYRFKYALSKVIRRIQNLQKLFFEVYIKRDYLNKLYCYERKIHSYSRSVLSAMNALRKQSISPQEKNKVEHVAQLYDAVLSVGSLRYRVPDFSTFQMIEKELQDIHAISLDKISERIPALEILFFNTLTVAASDPNVFFLFIQALKNIEREITNVQKAE